MFASYSFPIGERPTNAAWAGFQFINEKQDAGYLLLFRELHNEEASKPIQLKFLAGKRLKISDLRSRQTQEVEVSKEGFVTFTIDKPADYSFLQYKVIL